MCCVALCAAYFLLGYLFIDDISKPTAVIILGGGVKDDGGVPVHTQLRLDVAVKIYKQLGEKAIFIPLSGGTPHKPNPVDLRGFPVWECTAAARRLLDMGIPAHQIMEESTSLDTIGNAYFLRAVHLQPAQLQNIIVITNSWHMPRTKAIFDFVLSLPSSAISTTFPHVLRNWFGKSSYAITYLEAGAGIPDEHLLQVRMEKEANALAQFTNNIVPSITSFQALHLWLFTKHGAYSTSRLTVVHADIPADLLKTY